MSCQTQHSIFEVGKIEQHPLITKRCFRDRAARNMIISSSSLATSIRTRSTSIQLNPCVWQQIYPTSISCSPLIQCYRSVRVPIYFEVFALNTQVECTVWLSTKCIYVGSASVIPVMYLNQFCLIVSFAGSCGALLCCDASIHPGNIQIYLINIHSNERYTARILLYCRSTFGI